MFWLCSNIIRFCKLWIHKLVMRDRGLTLKKHLLHPSKASGKQGTDEMVIGDGISSKLRMEA